MKCKLIKIISLFFILISLLSISITTFAADGLGVLTEDGFLRYDVEPNGYFSFTGSSWVFRNEDRYYLKDLYYAQTQGDTFAFEFYSNKIRIMGEHYPSVNTSNMVIEIDGQIVKDNINENLPKQDMVIEYANSNLDSSLHTCKIYSTSSGHLCIEAIDIDKTGYIVKYAQPQNLTVKQEDKSARLDWNKISGASGYNVKRSTTPGGPYDIIGPNTTVTSNTYTDETVDYGKTYYYVVSAIVDGKESSDSITIIKPEVVGNNAILELTMTNGDHKEYDMTATELSNFLAWYDLSSSGTGKAYYVITKKDNTKPFLSRKEYIAFDKISSFEVKEYSDN